MGKSKLTLALSISTGQDLPLLIFPLGGLHLEALFRQPFSHSQGKVSLRCFHHSQTTSAGLLEAWCRNPLEANAVRGAPSL